jgi:hypothetical protein
MIVGKSLNYGITQTGTLNLLMVDQSRRSSWSALPYNRQLSNLLLTNTISENQGIEMNKNWFKAIQDDPKFATLMNRHDLVGPNTNRSLIIANALIEFSRNPDALTVRIDSNANCGETEQYAAMIDGRIWDANGNHTSPESWLREFFDNQPIIIPNRVFRVAQGYDNFDGRFPEDRRAERDLESLIKMHYKNWTELMAQGAGTFSRDNHWAHLTVIAPDTTTTQFLVRQAALNSRDDLEITLHKNGLTSRPVKITIPQEGIADLRCKHIRDGDNAPLSHASAHSIMDPLDWRRHNEALSSFDNTLNASDYSDLEYSMTPGF